MEVHKGEVEVRGASRRYKGKTERDRLIEGEAILRDRAMGLSLSQLMDKYGYGSSHTVISRIDEALKARIATTVDAYREQQNDIIDMAMTKLGDSIETGEKMVDHGRAQQSVAIMERGQLMINNALRIMTTYLDRRARLNGLDAPTRVDTTVTVLTQEDLALQELIRETEARVHETA